MPRVLIVSYPWLPAFNAGVRHVATLARYLPEAGWDPIILARDWSEGGSDVDSSLRLAFEGTDELPSMRAARALPVVHAAFEPRDNRLMHWQALVAAPAADRTRHLRRMARAALDAAYPMYGAYPDAFRGWAARAAEAGVAAIRQFGIGAVVSISSPDSAHIAGGEMARAAGVPWIPIFGELGSFRTGPGDGRSTWQRLQHHELARRWLRGAAGAVTVSPEMTEHIERNYAVTPETFPIPFDPDERRLPPRRVPGSPMRLVHVGRIVPDARGIRVLLDALDLLLQDDASVAGRLQVELVGSECDDELTALSRGRPAAALLRIAPRVRPAEAVTLQREADVLLYLDRADPLARYHSTLFEQLNARRPTISIGGEDGFTSRVLRETRGGNVGEDAASVASHVRGAMTELASAGEVAFTGDDAAIARYGGPEQARRLAKMLDVASAGRFGTWQRG